MTGVAAAVRDVRLGDVAVATEGIVDYDQVRRFHGMVSLRRHTDGMSAEMRRAVTARRELACSPETGRVDDRRVLAAVLYLTQAGCSWWKLPEVMFGGLWGS